MIRCSGRIHPVVFTGSLALLILAAACAGGGCTTVVVASDGDGVGTFAYVNGKMTGAEEATIDQVWEATEATVRELQFKVDESAKDALTAHIYATQADRTKVKIWLTRRADRLTEVNIRIGTFGSQAQSRLIYDKIKGHLRNILDRPPEVAPPAPSAAAPARRPDAPLKPAPIDLSREASASLAK